MTPRRVLKFKARFYEVLNWHQNAQVQVFIDSRSGRGRRLCPDRLPSGRPDSL